MNPEQIAGALHKVARRWRDPEHESRRAAVERTLEAPNRFTREAVAYAINQQMKEVAADALLRWSGGRTSILEFRVGVLNAGNVPFAGLQDLLAVLITGNQYVGVLSSKSPHLLRAFADEVQSTLPGVPVRWVSYDEMLDIAEVVIATGSDDTREAVEHDLDRVSVDESRRLIRGHRFSVAVIDGRETKQERDGLAEDTLLHEGAGCRNVAIIWAPRGLSPDPYLDSMAEFRGVFPAHERTPASLKMHRAMLSATGQPHAHGEGLEFLVSRGEAEPQLPGHVRWAEYDTLDEADAWVFDHRHRLQVVVARPEVARRLQCGSAPEGLSTPRVEVVAPGEAQRPPLNWQADGKDTIRFLLGLS